MCYDYFRFMILTYPVCLMITFGVRYYHPLLVFRLFSVFVTTNFCVSRLLCLYVTIIYLYLLRLHSVFVTTAYIMCYEYFRGTLLPYTLSFMITFSVHYYRLLYGLRLLSLYVSNIFSMCMITFAVLSFNLQYLLQLHSLYVTTIFYVFYDYFRCTLLPSSV